MAKSIGDEPGRLAILQTMGEITPCPHASGGAAGRRLVLRLRIQHERAAVPRAPAHDTARDADRPIGRLPSVLHRRRGTRSPGANKKRRQVPGRGVPARVPKNTPDVSWIASPEGFLIHVDSCPKAPPHALDLSTPALPDPRGSRPEGRSPHCGPLRPEASRSARHPARRPGFALRAVPPEGFPTREGPSPKARSPALGPSARRLQEPRGSRPEDPSPRLDPSTRRLFDPCGSRPEGPSPQPKDCAIRFTETR